eukprot:COSAG05_NODE_680_length_7966_cov_41.137028_1_plen_102_part_00
MGRYGCMAQGGVTLNPTAVAGNIVMWRAAMAMMASLASADAHFPPAVNGNGGWLARSGPANLSCATSTAWGRREGSAQPTVATADAHPNGGLTTTTARQKQ